MRMNDNHESDSESAWDTLTLRCFDLESVSIVGSSYKPLFDPGLDCDCALLDAHGVIVQGIPYTAISLYFMVCRHT